MRYALTFSAVVETLDTLETTMENPCEVYEGMLSEAVADFFEQTLIRDFTIVPSEESDLDIGHDDDDGKKKS